MKRSILTPLLYGVILFLLIRLANDLPMGANYLAHSWRFIAIELAGVVCCSFLCYRLYQAWIRRSIIHGMNVLEEYAVVILVPAVMALLVMALSHDVPLLSELSELVVPTVITVLMSVWLYHMEKNYLLQVLYSESQLKEQQMLRSKTVTELRLLQAQFHPHFLFNMLNAIYFTIDQNNEKARASIEHLSNLLRAQLYEGSGMVALEREVSALRSYIELCRLRFGNSIEIMECIETADDVTEIHPHLLLPLVENAVKHSGGNPRRVMIRLDNVGDMLRLTVENTVSVRKPPTKESGLGLSNLRKRLDLLYPEKYELSIAEKENLYHAILILKLS